jgi:hypothetical protein
MVHQGVDQQQAGSLEVWLRVLPARLLKRSEHQRELLLAIALTAKTLVSLGKGLGVHGRTSFAEKLWPAAIQP